MSLPRLVPSLLTLCALAACGGGGGEAPTTEALRANAASQRSKVAEVGGAAAPYFPPDLTIPTDAHEKGAWSRVYNWPHVAVHTVLMPDGRVMTFGSQPNGSQGGRFQYDIWEGTGAPDLGHNTLPNTAATEIFCSTQIVLPGTTDVFIGGGDNWTGMAVNNTGNATTTLFSGSSNTIRQTADMNRPRWYATSTTLVNGEIFIQGGLGGTDRPEIRALDGSFRLLDTVDTTAYNFWYPHNYVTTDGRIFGYDTQGQMYYINPRTQEHTTVGQLPVANVGSDTSSALFRPGRVLHIGGNSNGALVIDFTAGSQPVVTPTQSLSTQRRLVSATLLADGQVLATGGSEIWNTLTGVNNTAEIWNPATGQWTEGHEGTLARLYHSGALLMPDASVLVVGGGADSPTSSLPLNNTNVEVYYPPYLFQAGGQRAERPTLSSAPMSIEIGKTFTLGVGAQDQISRVTLVKTGSTTHSRNMDQRFLELTFTANAGQLTVQAPAHAGDATPGAYMVFVINAQGVPSVASIVNIGVASDPNPALVPELQKPADRSATVGSSQTLALVGSDPNGDTLSYSAAGLPPGLSLNAATGAITGTLTEAGTYSVTVSVSDGANVASAGFTWTVAHANALFLDALSEPSPVSTQGSASFTATVTGGQNPSYRWNFGDGSDTTEWSSQSTITHTYTSPGSYSVTFYARDDRGELITRSFLQTVYLPATTHKPAASSQMLMDATAARLWVVNPDNDSVSAFNLSTRTRVAEVQVGADPRTLAQAADGTLWVVNKTDASISVLAPATGNVVATVALPRASQPHGIVMSPDGLLAYVTLEATGQLLRLDTASRSISGSLAVGQHPRHLSVTGDGSQLYVSRFISPLLPGESGLNIAPTLSTGGEVLRINASTLQLDKTIVLRVSDVPDGQNSGRGLPNYLGPAVISPDGSQAWVAHKVDNVQRGGLRDGLPLNFQNSVRTAASRILLGSGTEDYAHRLDLDNASMTGAAAYDPLGVYLFVALETSREVVVMNAHEGRELLRFDVGRTPQGLAVSADGQTLYVHNFMDRSLGIYDLRPLMQQGLASVPRVTTVSTITHEKLTPQILLGKQLFHDARDPRLSRDNYLSCASCHDEGGHDGRVWDFSNFGEGLRNTINLRGRAGAQGRQHWSGNFDEIQDFEGQIRAMAGGTGLMSDAQFQTGTRADPLGDRKEGLSPDLDALAAYVGSLKTFDASPYRNTDGSLTAEAVAGRSVFAAQCASCHAGTGFTDSPTDILRNVGTLKTSSNTRLGAKLNGIDTPTLRDVWDTAPYFHDGSAPTLEAAITGHANLNLSPADLASVVAFARQIGREESVAPSSTANLVVRAGGASAGHIGPLMSVRVNGQVIAQAQIDGAGGQDYIFNTPFLTANTPIDLVFTNDERIGTEDRSLAVGLVRLNQSVTLRTLDPGVTLDQGSGEEAFDGINTIPGASASGVLSSNGAFRLAVPADMTPPGGGTDTVTLRAKANLAGGIGANVVLRVNGQVVGTQTVDSITEQNYVFNAPTLKGNDKIDVVFTNDAAIGGANRDLFIRSVKTSLYTLTPADAGAIIDKGEGSAAFDGLDLESGAIYGGWVPWNAALRLTVPVAPPLVLRARGSLAGGQGPQVELRRNGSLIGSTTVSSTTMQDYSFPDVVLLPGDKIDVVFTNDASIGEDDRNLYVGSLTSGSTVMRPGDAGSYIDIGEGEAAFDGVEIESATIYGGWIAWSASMRLLVPDPSLVPTPDTVVVKAASVQAGGVGAQIALRVNGVTFSSHYVDSAAVQSYSFPSPTLAPGDKLDIVYLNDEVVGGVDRNLYIESVTAAGLTLRPGDAGAVIDVGEGQAAFDGLDLRAASIHGGWVPWNSAMRWTLPSAPAVPRTDSVTVHAKAMLADGVGALVELRINGEFIDSVTVSSTTLADHVIATPPVAAGDKVDVVFANDAVIGGQDRNLFVATVLVRGTTLTPANGPLDVGTGQTAFDGVNVVAGDIYGGWIPWNAALRLTAP